MNSTTLNSATAQQMDEEDEWCRAQIEQAIAEADDPKAKWVSNEDANLSWKKRRATRQDSQSKRFLIRPSWS